MRRIYSEKPSLESTKNGKEMLSKRRMEEERQWKESASELGKLEQKNYCKMEEILSVF